MTERDVLLGVAMVAFTLGRHARRVSGAVALPSALVGRVLKRPLGSSMMSNTPVIRLARAGDAAGIAATLRDLGFFAPLEEEPVAETQARVAEQLARCAANGDHTVLVAEEESGQISGYLAAHWFPNLLKGGDGYISELFLREAARGKGLGGRLLAAIEAEGKRRGCTRLLLFNRKERASYQRGFYQQHGWEERDDTALFNRWLTEDW